MRFLAWKYVTSWRFLILGHQLVVSYRAVSYNRILRVVECELNFNCPYKKCTLSP